MKKYLIALMVGVLALAACGTNNNTDSDNDTPDVDVTVVTGDLADGVFGIREERYASFELPEFWSIAEGHSDDRRQVFFPGTTVLEDPSNVSIEIMPTGMPADNYEEISEDFRQFVEDMLIQGSENAMILGHDHMETNFGGAIVTVYSGTVGERGFVRTQYYLLVDDYIAVVVATDYHDDDSDSAASVALHIVNTIQFNNLADVPEATMAPRMFGGGWDLNVYTNETLGIRFELPDDWTPFPRELIAMRLGEEAEQLIEVMAVSDQDEMVQVFLGVAYEGWGVAEFMADFVSQIELGDAAQIGEMTEVVIAGHNYISNISSVEQELGGRIMQYTFARELDDDLILAIAFMYNEDMQSDVLGFLEGALGE